MAPVSSSPQGVKSSAGIEPAAQFPVKVQYADDHPRHHKLARVNRNTMALRII